MGSCFETAGVWVKCDEDKNNDEDVPEFIMLPSRKTRGNLHRLATESEEICEGDDDNKIQLWNSKSEYGKTKIVRWKPTLDYAWHLHIQAW